MSSSPFWGLLGKDRSSQKYKYSIEQMAPPSAWLMAVKEAHAKLKKKNPKATLGDAMKEAKKTYKKK